MANRIGEPQETTEPPCPIPLAWMVNQIDELNGSQKLRRDPIRLDRMVTEIRRLTQETDTFASDPIRLVRMVNQIVGARCRRAICFTHETSSRGSGAMGTWP
jgi:hypothetical protein